jgi:hypothetical protein
LFSVVVKQRWHEFIAPGFYGIAFDHGNPGARHALELPGQN